MKRKELFARFLEIRKTSGLKFYDTHIHPVDVFGVRSKKGDTCRCVSKPSLLEQLKYNDLALLVLRQLFFLTPAYIRSEIRKKYSGLNETQILAEMKSAGIDGSVILPIYPKATPEGIYSTFTSEKFIRLGSINFELEGEQIEKDLLEQIQRYSIVGIKLHPNIQQFYPDPSSNDDALKDKLEVVYRIAKEHRLYLLFHGGISFVPSDGRFSLRQFALVENFSKDDAFLSSLQVPVVIAHLGIYNIVNPDLRRLREMVEMTNVYFDTAGVNPAHIRDFLKMYGPDKLIFGSDMPYFNLKHSIELVLEAIDQFDAAVFDKNVLKIFGTNYRSSILKL